MSDATERPAAPEPPAAKGLTILGRPNGAICDENGCEIPPAAAPASTRKTPKA